MTKIKDNSGLSLILEQYISDLKSIVSEMNEKRGRSFLLWMENQNKYLKWEENFDPKKLKRYKRGEVVLIQFGFNTGSEHGGPHWGVIVDDNKKSQPTAIVIPLGSLDELQSEKDVHHDDVFLGNIQSINDKLVFAIPSQIRAVSKLRIIKPRKSKDISNSLTNEQLNLIDEKLYSSLFLNSKIIELSSIENKEIAVTK